MARTPRIGIQIDHDDPYWVQVGEAIRQQGRSRSAEVVEVAIHEHHLLSADEQIEVVEGLVVQELDVLVCNTYPPSLLGRILERGLPIVYISEIGLRHRLLSSRTGLYEAARLLGAFLDARLPEGAQILVVGLHDEEGDTGQSRLDGFRAGLAPRRLAGLSEVGSGWLYEDGRRSVEGYLAARPELAVDAIFGLSDSLALAARDACGALGRLRDGVPVVGVNGDPLALAAITAGQMAATVETDVDDMATRALDLALRAAGGEELPAHFECRLRLITAENVAEAATRKLISLADLPTRLIEDNKRHERQRALQAETSVAIDRKVGLLLDEGQLSQAITTLIRDSYGFDRARFLRLDPDGGLLLPSGERAPDEPGGPLAYALAHSQLVFIPDTAASHRFAPDPLWPDALARVVAPVRLGGQLIGLLDLHRRRVTHHTREELAGLQLLADRVGITVRNAQLYGQEQEARALAEQADRIKTTLLANVSHELRTPLNVILGYSRGALDALARGEPPPAELAGDLGQIYRSGEHLLRLINDLLDLSRAEIGELDLLPERIAPRAFLEDVFRSSADSFGAGGAVAWRLGLPPELPPIEADPVRLRQVLLNLLHNAHKFTERGEIALGAEAVGGELHIWVSDTGPGIAPELQGRIFDPFASGGAGPRRHEGIGLGLSITRRLVALHRGRLAVESAVGRGSTFHIYLPAPAPADPGADEAARKVLLLISEGSALPAPIVQLAERRGLALRTLRSGDNLAGVLQQIRPALLAWDVATAGDDGWRVIEEIRGRPELRQLPVMIYGGAADAAADTAGVATGVLLKPLGEVRDRVWLRAADGWEPAEPFSRTTENTMSIDQGDLDNDGRPELYAVDMKPYDVAVSTMASWLPLMAKMPTRHDPADPQVVESVLQVRGAGGAYTNQAYARGVDAVGWGWSGKFGDLDRDGLLDLYVVNGMIAQELFGHLPGHELVEQNQALRNGGDGRFRPAPEWGLGSTLSGRGMSMGDLDGDGDLDIVVNNLRGPAQLFENRLCGGEGLLVELRWPGSGNTRAIGAQLALHTSAGSFYRDLRATSGYLSGDPAQAHFGVPAGATLERLEVRWPDGAVSSFAAPQARALLTITREEAR